jgi:hypothetical protein
MRPLPRINLVRIVENHNLPALILRVELHAELEVIYGVRRVPKVWHLARAERVGALTGERPAAAWSPRAWSFMWIGATQSFDADHQAPDPRSAVEDNV